MAGPEHLAAASFAQAVKLKPAYEEDWKLFPEVPNANAKPEAPAADAKPAEPKPDAEAKPAEPKAEPKAEAKPEAK